MSDSRRTTGASERHGVGESASEMARRWGREVDADVIIVISNIALMDVTTVDNDGDSGETLPGDHTYVLIGWPGNDGKPGLNTIKI